MRCFRYRASVALLASYIANLISKLIPLRPLIDDSERSGETSRALLSAFRKHGFLYVTDFSQIIPQTSIDAVFASSACFFKRPLEEKNALAWTTPRANRGYTRQGREKTSQALTKEEVARDRENVGEDLKESFEIGREGQEGYPNRWPNDGSQESVSFVRLTQDFHRRCHEVIRLLMRGIAIGMGLDKKFFDPFNRVGDNTLRLLHYGPVAAGGFEGGKRVRAGEHTDYGSLTLLFQDSKGGLQVEVSVLRTDLDLSRRFSSS